MNTRVINNFDKLKRYIFLLPFILITTIVLYLFTQDALNNDGYIQIQKKYFYLINNYLGQYPNIEYNLTQFGDASIFLSFLIIFKLIAPKIWESLLSALLVSIVITKILKDFFLVPRPAQMFDCSSFIIIGKKAIGFASLPSGHSITVFTILTVFMFGFMPTKLNQKILWIFIFVTFGLLFAFSRVALGAHYPLDVIIGSIIGYFCGLLGIFISRKYKIWGWINNKKYCPLFILTIFFCSITLIIKTLNDSCFVFYLALISLFISLYYFVYGYLKK